MALKTMHARMDAICHLYSRGGSAGVDVKARIESGAFLSKDEVAALRRDLRKASTQRRARFSEQSEDLGEEQGQAGRRQRTLA
jgi:hypothetical protein